MTAKSLHPHEEPAPGSARWMVPVALFVSLGVAFLDRMNLSFAVPEMAAHYDWSVEEVGHNGSLLMSLFFIGYGLSNIFLSGFAGRIGPRKSLLTIVLLFSLFTMLGAPAAGISFVLFGLTRFALGISEGVHFPMMSMLTRNWFPISERSRANSLWVSGILIATFAAPFILLPIIERWGWQTMLLISGGMGLLISWPVVWMFVHDSPAQSPRLSHSERTWLNSQLAHEPQVEEKPGWGFFRMPDFHIALVGAILNNIFSMGFLMWLPTFYREARGMSAEDLKWAATAPYFFGLAGLAFYGWLGDRIGRRTILAGAGYAASGVLALAAMFVESHIVMVGLFGFAAFFQATYTSQEWAILQRILPTGSIARGSGVYNGLGILIGGGFGQLVIGEVIAQSKNYSAAIATITVAAFIATATMFILHRRVRV